MNHPFPEIKKNFGFGCMRFPTVGDQVDTAQVSKMVDAFLEAGFNYFDTARPYHRGASETTLRQCLTSRYPRDAYVLTDKLSFNFFETEAEIRPLFEDQLKECGVDYFDFYLIHANSGERHKKYWDTRAYEILRELKEEGKIRHIGMSFHDSAEVLDQILTEVPWIEVVQLQLNYVDWDDPSVQSRKCWEVARKHGKKILVMEPVKGGSLVNLPERAVENMTACSPAGYAIRFAASQEDVFMVLSGMSNLEQMMDNIHTMADFQPLNEEELAVIDHARTLYQAQHRIPCTACRYCTDGCPVEMDIPTLFAILNDKSQGKDGAEEAYAAMAVKPDSCVGCGQCEDACPQHLQIRKLLEEVAAAF